MVSGKIYQGMVIGGEWRGYATKIVGGEYIKISEDHDSIINLKQSGGKIIGTLLIVHQPDGEKAEKLFNLNGLFYNNHLILNSKPCEKSQMGGGSYIMKITENGKKFKGKQTYISSRDLSIWASDKMWIRQK